MTHFQVFITIPIRLGNYLKTLFIYSEQLGVWRYSLLISSCQFLLFQDYLSGPTLAHEYSHLRNQSQQSEKANHDCLTTTNYLLHHMDSGMDSNFYEPHTTDLSLHCKHSKYTRSSYIMWGIWGRKLKLDSVWPPSLMLHPPPRACSPVDPDSSRHYFSSPSSLPAAQVMPVTKAAAERVVGKLNNAKLFQT